MRKLTLFTGLILLITMIGCNNTKREYSEVLHEDAIVVALIYSPSEHKISLEDNTYDYDNRTVTQSGDKTKIRISDGVSVTSSTIPERFGVAFQCQHGTFTIEGTEQKHKVLYNKLINNLHDTVDVLYKQEYLVTYDDKNDDGVDEVVTKVLDDLDFIDAQIKPKK